MNRNSLNLLMVICFLVVMDYRFTGNAVHEVLGIFIAVVFIYHNVLNKRWYKTIGKGKLNLIRAVSVITNILLLTMMILVFVTGLLISQTVFPVFSSSRMLWLHELHTFSAYAGFVLSAIHLGLHWDGLYEKFCRWRGIDTENLSCVVVGRGISLIIVSYGIYASYSQQIGSKFLLQHTFSGWEDVSLLMFVLDYLAIMGLYVAVAHYSKQLIKSQTCEN